MNWSPPRRPMLADRRGSGTAEFALVLPLLIIFLLGIVDIGRVMWVANMAEKATQMGARYAIVTNVLPTQLSGADYTNVVACDPNEDLVLDACKTGDFIVSTAALGTLSCTNVACTCTPANSCPSGATIDPLAFQKLGLWMRNFYPDAADGNVVVIFRGSGLGFAGDPTGMDVVPLVTVKLTGLSFAPVSLFKFVSFTLPSFATTLTDESAVGTQSN